MDREIYITVMANIIAATAVALVQYFFKMLIIDRRWIQKWRSILIGLLTLLLMASAYVCLSLIWSLLPPAIAFPDGGWIIISIIFWSQILLAIILIHLIRRIHPARVNSCQYNPSFWVAVKKPGKRIRKIAVRKLIRNNISSEERLRLNWQTFGDGMVFLKEQIRDCQPAVIPDLIFGINDAGIMITRFLTSTLGVGKRLAGYTWTEGDEHEISKPYLPVESGQIKRILIVDSQVKRGDSLRNVFEFLTNKFGNGIEIKIAVLAACAVRDNIQDISELNKDEKGIFEQDWKLLPDFLAYIAEGRIIFPENIR
jgi:hypoxanthine phosphoribosyltransferase